MPEMTELYALTERAANTAMINREWILCATLCRTLAELELAEAVAKGAVSAWNEATGTVPLLNLPMRDEQPRPVAEATYDHPATCTRCGKPAHWVPAIETTEPRGWVPAAWVHDDAVLGADHNVEPAPIWQCPSWTNVHEAHEWIETVSGRHYRCPGRTVDL